METSTVTPVDGFKYFGVTPAAKKPDLDMETFMRLLVVQLVNQDPLEPMSDRDFFAQMAQLGQVQGLDGLQASADSSQAASYIGKTVTAVRPTTNEGAFEDPLVVGVVTGVVVRSGEQKLVVTELDGGIVEVGLGAIQSVAYDDHVQQTLDASQAVTLIGKTVKAVNTEQNPDDPTDDFIEGTVERINFQNGSKILGVRTVAGDLVFVGLGSIAEVNG